jgi:hypothetical protein
MAMAIPEKIAFMDVDSPRPFSNHPDDFVNYMPSHPGKQSKTPPNSLPGSKHSRIYPRNRLVHSGIEWDRSRDEICPKAVRFLSGPEAVKLGE